MGYVHCMPARVVTLSHALDNIVSGTLRTDEGDIPFKTRMHIVKATNKLYRNCPWKPSAGDEVLVDGDIGLECMMVDHIEKDHLPRANGGASSPHLDHIAGLLPKHPSASKTLRVWRRSEPIRIRFAATASRRDRRGIVQDEIIHAVHDNGEWSLWTVAKDGGAVVATGIDEAILPILARAAGCDLISGETEREKNVRIEEEERRACRKPAYEPPPFDDVPF